MLGSKIAMLAGTTGDPNAKETANLTRTEDLSERLVRCWKLEPRAFFKFLGRELDGVLAGWSGSKSMGGTGFNRS